MNNTKVKPNPLLGVIIVLVSIIGCMGIFYVIYALSDPSKLLITNLSKMNKSINQIVEDLDNPYFALLNEDSMIEINTTISNPLESLFETEPISFKVWKQEKDLYFELDQVYYHTTINEDFFIDKETLSNLIKSLKEEKKFESSTQKDVMLSLNGKEERVRKYTLNLSEEEKINLYIKGMNHILLMELERNNYTFSYQSLENKEVFSLTNKKDNTRYELVKENENYTFSSSKNNEQNIAGTIRVQDKEILMHLDSSWLDLPYSVDSTIDKEKDDLNESNLNINISFLKDTLSLESTISVTLTDLKVFNKDGMEIKEIDTLSENERKALEERWQKLVTF